MTTSTARRRTGRVDTCQSCGKRKKIDARDNCKQCLKKHYDAGTAGDLPLYINRADDVLDTWAMMMRRAPIGTSLRDIASQMGMSYDALTQALRRARHRRDPRAVYFTQQQTIAARLREGKFQP